MDRSSCAAITDVTWSGTGMMACPVGVLSPSASESWHLLAGPAASHADGSRRSVLGPDAIDPVAVVRRG